MPKMIFLRRNLNDLRVVAIVGLICSVTACGGVRWKLRMSMAEGALRKIERAQSEYKARHGKYASLRELSDNDLLTGDLGKGLGDGYRFEVRIGNNSDQAHALPDKSVDPRLPAYLLDETGVLHISALGAREATTDDPVAPEK